MASGDIVYQRNNLAVDNTTAIGQGFANPPDIVNTWHITFRTVDPGADSDKLNLTLDVRTDEYVFGIGANPFDPTKHYDLIIKEH